MVYNIDTWVLMFKLKIWNFAVTSLWHLWVWQFQVTRTINFCKLSEKRILKNGRFKLTLGKNGLYEDNVVTMRNKFLSFTWWTYHNLLNFFSACVSLYNFGLKDIKFCVFLSNVNFISNFRYEILSLIFCCIMCLWKTCVTDCIKLLY